MLKQFSSLANLLHSKSQQNDSNNNSNPSSFFTTFLEKSSKILRSPYTSIAVAGSLLFGMPLLRNYYKEQTKPAIQKTIVEVHDAIFYELLREHRKNVRKGRASCSSQEDDDEQQRKCQERMPSVTNDDEDDDDEEGEEDENQNNNNNDDDESDFGGNFLDQAFIAVPFRMELDCLARLVKTNKSNQTTTVRSSSPRLSSFKAVVDDNDTASLEFNVAVTLRSPLLFTGRNYLLLSPNFITNFGEGELAHLITLAFEFMDDANTSTNDDETNQSMIQDLLALYLLLTTFQAQTFLSSQIRCELRDSINKSRSNDEKRNIAQKVVQEVFEMPSVEGHSQMISFLSTIELFLQDRILGNSNFKNGLLYEFVRSTSLVLSNIFTHHHHHHHAINDSCTIRKMSDDINNIEIHLEKDVAYCPPLEFHRLLLIDKRDPSSSSSFYDRRPGGISKYCSNFRRELQSTVKRALHDFIPLFGKYDQLKRAIKWIPMTAVVFQLGSTLFFTAVSKVEWSVQAANEELGRTCSSTSDHHHHHNQGEAASLSSSSSSTPSTLLLFDQIRILALESTWLQQTIMTFGHSWVQYITDSQMSQRWFLLAMTSDYDDGSGQSIDDTLASVARTLESVPGLLTTLDASLYFPTNNLVGMMMMVLGSDFLMNSSSTSSTTLEKTSIFSLRNTWLLVFFICLKRFHGAVFDKHCLDSTTLNFSFIWNKRINAREEARMKRLFMKLDDEKSSQEEEKTMMRMFSLDPFVNTANIFCNALGPNYHGSDGFEEADDFCSHEDYVASSFKEDENSSSSCRSDRETDHSNNDDDYEEPSLEAMMMEFSGDNNNTQKSSKSNPAIMNHKDKIQHDDDEHYVDDDDEDCFWWSLPEPSRHVFSDTAHRRQRHRRPTLGLALLAVAIGNEGDEKNRHTYLNYLVGEQAEKARPSSHLVIRWPSSPLAINRFLAPHVLRYHPEYLFPLHQSLRNFLELSIRMSSSHTSRSIPTASSPSSSPSPSSSSPPPDNSQFFIGKRSKPSFETIQALFETDRFRAVRAAGFEVEAALSSAPRFVAQLESHLDHPFNFAGGFGKGSMKLGHDLCDGLEEGILEVLSSSSKNAGSSSSPFLFTKEDQARLRVMNVSADSLKISGSNHNDQFSAGTSDIFELRKKQLEYLPDQVDLHDVSPCHATDQESNLNMLEQMNNNNNNQHDTDDHRYSTKYEEETSIKNHQQITSLLKNELHRSRIIDVLVGLVNDDNNSSSSSKTSFENNILKQKNNNNSDNNNSSSCYDWEFRNVSFAYPSDPDKFVLKNISFKISTSITKSVGICGESGSGKTTLFLLMMKIYTPTRGQILLNGVDLREVPSRWLRRHLSYVGPCCKLFRGASARGQVLTANPLIDNESEATVALRDAQVPAEMFEINHNNNNQKTDKQQKQSFPTASSMSGGEQQRVQIARAFGKINMARRKVKNTDKQDNRVIALLFDEGTSALDAKTEEAVIKAIDGECNNNSDNHAAVDGGIITTNNTTTMIIPRFVIAHRLFTIRDCDTILVIHKHRLITQGTFFQCVKRAATAATGKEGSSENEENSEARNKISSQQQEYRRAGLKWFFEGVQKQTLKGEEDLLEKMLQEVSSDDDDNDEVDTDEVLVNIANEEEFDFQSTTVDENDDRSFFTECDEEEEEGENEEDIDNLRNEIEEVLGREALAAFDRMIDE